MNYRILAVLELVYLANELFAHIVGARFGQRSDLGACNAKCAFGLRIEDQHSSEEAEAGMDDQLGGTICDESGGVEEEGTEDDSISIETCSLGGKSAADSGIFMRDETTSLAAYNADDIMRPRVIWNLCNFSHQQSDSTISQRRGLYACHPGQTSPLLVGHLVSEIMLRMQIHAHRCSRDIACPSLPSLYALFHHFPTETLLQLSKSLTEQSSTHHPLHPPPRPPQPSWQCDPNPASRSE